MKFVEEMVDQLLLDLDLPNEGLMVVDEAVKARLTSRESFLDVMQRLQDNPKYGPKIHPHPWGVYLVFQNVNCQREQALVDVSIDLRSRSGYLASIRGVVFFAQVFSKMGGKTICLSYPEMDEAVRRIAYEDTEEAVVASLA